MSMLYAKSGVGFDGSSANECRTDPLRNRKQGPDDLWAAQAFEQGCALGACSRVLLNEAVAALGAELSLGDGCASAVSSIQPVALLFKSWIWAKPASRPMNRNGRPAGKPYKTEAEEDGPANTSTGRFVTKMPEPAAA